MNVHRSLFLIPLLLSCRHAPVVAAPPRMAARIFRFQTDQFWLNLHSYLYVLGRAKNGAPDARREAVVDAPREAASALAGATDTERAVWNRAVSEYAATLSRRDAVFDADLSTVTGALADAGDAPKPPNVSVAATLAAAAPVYRRLWWPANHDANIRWRNDVQRSVDRYGAEVLAYIERAYDMRWPPDGFPVNVSAYSSWAGAYSTGGNLLVVSSLDPDLHGLRALETVFHEGMHQWDDQMAAILDARARRLGVGVPRDLSHAMIFFTSGEAVRAIADTTYVPNAQALGIWSRGLEAYRQALEAEWRPHLDGRIGRDAAIDSVLLRLRDK
jgi:hypothetical protein